jgi:hypothetical protein
MQSPPTSNGSSRLLAALVHVLVKYLIRQCVDVLSILLFLVIWFDDPIVVAAKFARRYYLEINGPSKIRYQKTRSISANIGGHQCS